MADRPAACFFCSLISTTLPSTVYVIRPQQQKIELGTFTITARSHVHEYFFISKSPNNFFPNRLYAVFVLLALLQSRHGPGGVMASRPISGTHVFDESCFPALQYNRIRCMCFSLRKFQFDLELIVSRSKNASAAQRSLQRACASSETTNQVKSSHVDVHQSARQKNWHTRGQHAVLSHPHQYNQEFPFTLAK